MEKDTMSRKWQVTLNNPLDKGYTHEKIREIIDNSFKNIKYYCFCDEVGKKEHTEHTHIFIWSNNGIRFSTMQNKLGGAHYEMARGTAQQNRDYIRKEGKYAEGEKKETNLIDTFFESCDLPEEHQGARNDLYTLYEMIKSGYDNYQIIEECPDYMMDIERVERVRQVLREERYKNQFRIVDTTYIWGNTGTGKSRHVMEKYGYENVYRITDYKNPFDGYKGQDVVIFEEFRSSLKIQDMLNYLDGYPLQLPCRYNNKVACFTKVYVCTNICIDEQYELVREFSGPTWDAFIRRITRYLYFNGFEILEFKNYADYLFNYVQRGKRETEYENQEISENIS